MAPADHIHAECDRALAEFAKTGKIGRQQPVSGECRIRLLKPRWCRCANAAQSLKEFNMKPLWETVRGRATFLSSLEINVHVLDVGCGNNSPAYFKWLRPDFHYTGIDVGDYNQSGDPKAVADEYIIVRPEEFAVAIERCKDSMDAVVSAHNLEHCDEPQRVLIAMADALKLGGRLYLSFPCEQSVGFPNRAGSLNFYDDGTHTAAPPVWQEVLDTLTSRGCHFDFRAKRYRPFPLALKGLMLEPISALRRQVIDDGSTWALYGFESVIWATKAR
jgi:SAM-dependent methyltransferase